MPGQEPIWIKPVAEGKLYQEDEAESVLGDENVEEALFGYLDAALSGDKDAQANALVAFDNAVKEAIEWRNPTIESSTEAK